MATGTDPRKGQPIATSLYDLSVPTFLQTVTAVAGLFADMAPFHFQIEAAWHHAVWGVEALRTGAFTPPPRAG